MLADNSPPNWSPRSAGEPDSARLLGTLGEFGVECNCERDPFARIAFKVPFGGDSSQNTVDDIGLGGQVGPGSAKAAPQLDFDPDGKLVETALVLAQGVFT